MTKTFKNLSTQSYSSKSTALRGAKRAGQDMTQIVANAIDKSGETRWVYGVMIDVEPVVEKVVKIRNGSVAQIWNFLASTPDMTRKDQIASLIAQGHAPGTVRVQTSRFYKYGTNEAFLADERAKRALKV